MIWGQERSNCSNHVNNISRREAWTNLIFGMYMYPIENKKPIVFGRGHRSFGVSRGQTENLVNTISQEGKLGQLSYLVIGILVNHIEYKKPIVFSRDQRSFGVIRHQIVKILQMQYMKMGKLGEIS